MLRLALFHSISRSRVYEHVYLEEVKNDSEIADTSNSHRNLLQFFYYFFIAIIKKNKQRYLISQYDNCQRI